MKLSLVFFLTLNKSPTHLSQVAYYCDLTELVQADLLKSNYYNKLLLVIKIINQLTN